MGLYLFGDYMKFKLFLTFLLLSVSLGLYFLNKGESERADPAVASRDTEVNETLKNTPATASDKTAVTSTDKAMEAKVISKSSIAATYSEQADESQLARLVRPNSSGAVAQQNGKTVDEKGGVRREVQAKSYTKARAASQETGENTPTIISGEVVTTSMDSAEQEERLQQTISAVVSSRLAATQSTAMTNQVVDAFSNSTNERGYIASPAFNELLSAQEVQAAPEKFTFDVPFKLELNLTNETTIGGIEFMVKWPASTERDTQVSCQNTSEADIVQQGKTISVGFKMGYIFATGTNQTRLILSECRVSGQSTSGQPLLSIDDFKAYDLDGQVVSSATVNLLQ